MPPSAHGEATARSAPGSAASPPDRRSGASGSGARRYRSSRAAAPTMCPPGPPRRGAPPQRDRRRDRPAAGDRQDPPPSRAGLPARRAGPGGRGMTRQPFDPAELGVDDQGLPAAGRGVPRGAAGRAWLATLRLVFGGRCVATALRLQALAVVLVAVLAVGAGGTAAAVGAGAILGTFTGPTEP